jgi:surface protein
MDTMFDRSEFNQPIGKWNVSKVTNMKNMFNLSKYNQPLENWETGAVTDMTGMFTGSYFNHPIGQWDVSNVGKMEMMFYFAEFDQSITNWCVTKIGSEPILFSLGGKLKVGNKPKWGTCPESTSVEFEEFPVEFTLQQNYPNPFNPTTTIPFALPVSTHVKLEVYTINGQLISTLVDGIMNAGRHVVRFDATMLSSGTYLYRITTPDFSQTGTMSLVR